MKLFKVYKKTNLAEITNTVYVNADGEVICKYMLQPLDKDLLFIEWLDSDIVKGNGDWATYKMNQLRKKL